MDITYQLSKLLSIAVFLPYGVACALTGAMTREFRRYGLPRLRVLTGVLEVAGAAGLVCGYWNTAWDTAASAGLMLLMAGAVVTRVRIRDSLLATSPALLLMFANAFVFYASISR